MLSGRLPPIYGGNTGTIDVSKYGRTGATGADADFFRLYAAQLYVQNFDVLFGEEGVNNSVFGDSGVFGAASSSTSMLFGDIGQSSLPSDISGLMSQTGGNQYLELIARSNLPGKTVTALNPLTRKEFTGKVESVMIDSGMLMLTIDGIKVPLENLIEIKS